MVPGSAHKAKLGLGELPTRIMVSWLVLTWGRKARFEAKAVGIPLDSSVAAFEVGDFASGYNV
jgi:hypothetical protein